MRQHHILITNNSNNRSSPLFMGTKFDNVVVFDKEYTAKNIRELILKNKDMIFNSRVYSVRIFLDSDAHSLAFSRILKEYLPYENYVRGIKGKIRFVGLIEPYFHIKDKTLISVLKNMNKDSISK